jgi:hypothetical protein
MFNLDSHREQREFWRSRIDFCSANEDLLKLPGFFLSWHLFCQSHIRRLKLSYERFWA